MLFRDFCTRKWILLSDHYGVLFTLIPIFLFSFQPRIPSTFIDQERRKGSHLLDFYYKPDTKLDLVSSLPALKLTTTSREPSSHSRPALFILFLSFFSTCRNPTRGQWPVTGSQVHKDMTIFKGSHICADKISQTTWVYIPALPFPSCVKAGK